MTKKSIIIEKNNIIYYEYGSSNKENVVFLHGFSYSPKHYSFLKELGENYRVIAPLMYGINYLKEQPRTLDEYAELTKVFLKSLKIKPKYLLGHSMGGGVAYLISSKQKNIKKLILLNPVLENNKKVCKFILNSINKNKRNLSNKVKKEIKLDFSTYFKYLFSYALLVFKKPLTTIKLIKNISKFSYKKKLTTPTTLIYGTEDEFFKLNKTKLKKLKKLEIIELKTYNHDWPLLNPKKAKEEFLKSIKKK